MSNDEKDSAFAAIFLIVFLMVLLVGVGIFVHDNNYTLTPAYNVVDSKRPRDCDFTFAPIGEKGCHYKKVIAYWTLPNGDIGGGAIMDTPDSQPPKECNKCTVVYRWAKVVE